MFLQLVDFIMRAIFSKSIRFERSISVFLSIVIYFYTSHTLLDLKLLAVDRPPPRSQSWTVFFLRLHAIARPLHDLFGDM